ncbi:MAG: DUF4281 domain-containing protein [Chitinophagaceae bacterium]|jgi:hypothetical protein|nr:DUF4281 domain-containing protein [Chitinophagaceae bacterium]
MSPETIFSLCNTIALVGWLILLIASPFWFYTDKLLIGIIITLFAIVYTWLLASTFQFSDMEKFSTLDGVMELFTSKIAVTTAWIHFLAFDLMTGIWIKKNAQKHNISHWILIPCLFFTFMIGPVGLLLYLLIRFIRTKTYFADNY